MPRDRVKKDGKRWYYSMPKESVKEKRNNAANNSPVADVASSTEMKQVKMDLVAQEKSSTTALHARVKRVDGGVESIPFVELPSTTDLNAVPKNYLDIDTKYGVHRHAPWFNRNKSQAQSSLLQTAVTEMIQGASSRCSRHTSVIASGETLKQVFDSAIDDKPLALQVHRLGPSIVVDSRQEELGLESVQETREKSLFAKALYHTTSLVGEFPWNPSAHPDNENGSNSMEVAATSLSGSSALSQKIHSYANVFRWALDGFDVLLGVDTVLVRDQTSGVEMVLKLKESLEGFIPTAQLQIKEKVQETAPNEEHSLATMIPKAGQAPFCISRKEALEYWFDAMLTNVRNVALCIHQRGYVQEYQILPASELLGLSAASAEATMAMNFTGNVLQWLVKNCTKEGANYVVMRDGDSDSLKLFECDRSYGSGFLGTDEPAKNSANVSSSPPDDGPDDRQRLNRFVGMMCFRMGEHLVQTKSDLLHAISLLHRSFALLSEHLHHSGEKSMESSESFCSIASLLQSALAQLFEQQIGSSVKTDVNMMELAKLMADAVDIHEKIVENVWTVLDLNLLPLCVSHTIALDIIKSSFEIASRSLTALFQVNTCFRNQRRNGPGFQRKGNAVQNLKKESESVLLTSLKIFIMIHRLLEKTKKASAGQTRSNSEKPNLQLAEKKVDFEHVVSAFAELKGDLVVCAMENVDGQLPSIISKISNSWVKQNPRDRTGIEDFQNISTDPTALSFVAHRFYSQAANSSRLLLKSAHVYFNMGCHFFKSSRFTKALESLHRSKQLILAAPKVAEVDSTIAFCHPTFDLTQHMLQLSIAEVHYQQVLMSNNALAVAEVENLWQKALHEFQEAFSLRGEEDIVDCHHRVCDIRLTISEVMIGYVRFLLAHQDQFGSLEKLSSLKDWLDTVQNIIPVDLEKRFRMLPFLYNKFYQCVLNKQTSQNDEKFLRLLECSMRNVLSLLARSNRSMVAPDGKEKLSKFAVECRRMWRNLLEVSWYDVCIDVLNSIQLFLKYFVHNTADSMAQFLGEVTAMFIEAQRIIEINGTVQTGTELSREEIESLQFTVQSLKSIIENNTVLHRYFLFAAQQLLFTVSSLAPKSQEEKKCL